MSKRKTPAYIEDSDEELSKEVLAVPAGCVIHLQSEQCSGQTVGKPASPYWCRLANVVTITACSICISVFVPVANIMHDSKHCVPIVMFYKPSCIGKYTKEERKDPSTCSR